MKQRVRLMGAPPSIQPGGYVRSAYADRTEPGTPWADLLVESRGNGWHVLVSWACAEHRSNATTEVDRFVDAAAILSPMTPNAPILTMGDKDAGVEGWLWRADRERGLRISAQGLGTSARLDAPEGVDIHATWSDGRWGVSFDLPDWDSLTRQRLVGIAIWQGAAAERAGLKSVSPSWIPVT